MKLGSFLSREDAYCLLELIQQSLSCDNEKSLRDIISQLRVLIPYNFAICGFAKIDLNNKINSYDIINFNYPDEWVEIYINKDYHNVDPIVKENFSNFKPQYWVDTYKKYNPPKEFIFLAEDFGLKKGYAYGIKDKDNKGSIFSFADTFTERHPRTEIILKYIIPHLHQSLVRIMVQERAKQKVNLTPREKEVLKWIKEGKTSWDISVILGISERTVNFHINNIKHKLDAVSRVQAVAIAIEQGLIDIG